MLNLSWSNGPACGPAVIRPNVGFEIWDATNTNLLASGDTGLIEPTASGSPEWKAYALVFQTEPGQTDVILKMINRSSAGCGNDLAIDDIVFKTCGDLIAVQDSTFSGSEMVCSPDTPYAETITAIPDNVVFGSHFYQWQESTDGTTWTDVSGETNASISFTCTFDPILLMVHSSLYLSLLHCI